MIKCRWCKDTKLYYPLIGPPEECKECTTTNRVISIPNAGVATFSLQDLNQMTFKYLAAEGSMSKKQERWYLEKAGQPNLEAIDLATKEYIRPIVNQIFNESPLMAYLRDSAAKEATAAAAEREHWMKVAEEKFKQNLFDFYTQPRPLYTLDGTCTPLALPLSTAKESKPSSESNSSDTNPLSPGNLLTMLRS